MQRFSRSEQRQGRIAQRLQRPQRAAAVEAPIGLIQRTKRVGRGKAFEGGAAETTMAPQIARIDVTLAHRRCATRQVRALLAPKGARRDETLGIGFG
jgi:hypothetical protein